MTSALHQILDVPERDLQPSNKLDLITLSRKGLTLKQLKSILAFTALTLKDISKIIHLSERQLQRYTDEQVLNTDCSDQLLQIIELYIRGYEVFGSEEKFRTWMKRSNIALNTLKPADLLDTSFGIQLILDEIGRIEQGIVS